MGSKVISGVVVVFCTNILVIEEANSGIVISRGRAATSADSEMPLLRRLLRDLQQEQSSATTIYCDMSATAMTKNPVFHSCTKHIGIHHRFNRAGC
jgi:hypothetical protein